MLRQRIPLPVWSYFIINDMRLIVFLLFFISSNTLFSQTREDSLQTVIRHFFTCMQKNDVTGFAKIMDSHSELKTVIKYKDSVMVHSSTYAEFQSMMNEPLAGDWEEKLLNYSYFNDELMANVWTEYEFFFNGSMTHSGINQFTLVRNPTQKEFGWKIISIIDTRYSKGKGNLSYVEITLSEKKKINSLMDNWHKAAADANSKVFFGAMSDSCIYKGTDKTERWSKNAFIEFAQPYFDKGKAWDFKPLERNIRMDEQQQIAWFDERLDTWMGECKASGIWKKENGEWKMWLYDLSVTIDNDKIKSFIELSSK